jgi:hypothetical protein
MGLEHFHSWRVFRPTHDDDTPAILEEVLNQGVPVSARPALSGSPGSNVDGEQGRNRTESTGM